MNKGLVLILMFLISLGVVSAVDCVISDSAPLGLNQVPGIFFSNSNNSHACVSPSNCYSYRLYCEDPNFIFQNSGSGYPLLFFNENNSHVALPVSDPDYTTLLTYYPVERYFHSSAPGVLTCSLKENCLATEFCVLRLANHSLIGDGSPFNTHVSSCEFFENYYPLEWCCEFSASASCGDNIIESPEVCECGPDLLCGNLDDNVTGLNCTDMGSFIGGNLTCMPSTCQFNTSGCILGGEGVSCDNGTIDPGEDCDGLDLNGETCESLGWDNGSLGCYPAGHVSGCIFNETGCYNLTGGPGPGPVAGPDEYIVYGLCSDDGDGDEYGEMNWTMYDQVGLVVDLGFTGCVLDIEEVPGFSFFGVFLFFVFIFIFYFIDFKIGGKLKCKL